MDVLKIIATIIELIVLAIGVTMIFDARKIAEKWFSFGEKNESAKILKIVGFTISIIAAILVIFSLKSL